MLQNTNCHHLLVTSHCAYRHPGAAGHGRVQSVARGELTAEWKDEYTRWQKRDLPACHYVYARADGATCRHGRAYDCKVKPRCGRRSAHGVSPRPRGREQSPGRAAPRAIRGPCWPVGECVRRSDPHHLPKVSSFATKAWPMSVK